MDVNQALSIYLVDDEAPALERLARLVSEIEATRIVGRASDGRQLIDECRRLQPDLVLLDIEMPGDNGVRLASALRKLARPPALIFITAFEQYAVDAFDVNAVDYLVKPVRRQRLAQALDRVRSRRLPKVSEQAEPVLLARLGERVMRIPISQVRALIAEDKYISVHHVGGVALVEDSLVNLEERFGDRFLRIHRNALVALAHFRALFRDASGADRVEIDDVDCQPEVSRRNLPEVRRALKGMQ